MDLLLSGANVVVAGASKGLGFAIVQSLLNEGANVTAIARDVGGLSQAQSQWISPQNISKVDTVSIDLACVGAVESIRTEFENRVSPDVLVVVAGSGRPSEQTGIAAFEESFSKNLAPAINCVSAFAEGMQARQNSAVLLISSIASIEYLACPPEYAAAKSSLNAYSAHWSRIYKPTRFNVLVPGNIKTIGSVWDLKVQQDPFSLASMLIENVTLGRLSSPEEIADLATFLVSPRNSFMTGTTIISDGGQVKKW